MPQTSKNYVGVSGVASVEEAKSVASLARNAGFSMGSEHVPMIGLQASYKSLKYGFSEGNRRVPHMDMLAPILSAVRRDTFPTIHYYTKEPERLVDELTALLKYDGIYKADLVGGIQINRVWPTEHQMWELKNRFHGMKITLQMSKAVTGEMTDAQVAEKLAKEYKDVDYILLDSSHGKGVEFDQEGVVSTYETFRNGGVRSRMVIAGGFTGSNVKEKTLWLRGALGSTDFSIDAEGGLRDKLGEEYGNDVMNLDKVKDYLNGAAGILLAQKR